MTKLNLTPLIPFALGCFWPFHRTFAQDGDVQTSNTTIGGVYEGTF